MKILLAIDGSEHSKLTVEELASRSFPPKTQVRIVTVYTKPSKMVAAEAVILLRRLSSGKQKHLAPI